MTRLAYAEAAELLHRLREPAYLCRHAHHIHGPHVRSILCSNHRHAWLMRGLLCEAAEWDAHQRIPCYLLGEHLCEYFLAGRGLGARPRLDVACDIALSLCDAAWHTGCGEGQGHTPVLEYDPDMGWPQRA